ncbi:MAG: type II toxin-antitoxin system RelE/ParE family toxin [Saprospiraceae bacterium]|jgi:plasmid stabilization system protein ParE|nr:type II toxin-antitoxin system RelE/ParE family toxin [Saprospiraceae bacterium]
MKICPIFWSAKAKAEFVDILTFLEIQFGSEVAANCVLLVDAALEKIAVFPEMCPESGPHGIRKSVVQKNLSIFYRYHRGQIDVLKIWDNRQDPDNLLL